MATSRGRTIEAQARVVFVLCFLSYESSLLEFCVLSPKIVTPNTTLNGNTIQHSTAQHITIHHITTQHNMTSQHSTAQHNTAQHSTTHAISQITLITPSVSVMWCLVSHELMKCFSLGRVRILAISPLQKLSSVCTGNVECSC